MGSYTKRHFFLSVCVLQMVTVSVRQVFDFLGFMWGPVLANFFQILFIIFGFFGACQFRVKYLTSYTVWSVFWFSWNVFVVCFYLNIGGLNRNQNILNLGTGSVSWWESNGPGCKPLFHANLTTIDDPLVPVRPDSVVGCVLDYQYVEALQASVQNFLAMIGILISVSLIRVMLDDDDSSRISKNKKVNGPSPLYSIEYSRRQDTTDEYSGDSPTEDGEGDNRTDNPGSRPMTPRRVKRRSVHSRGSMPYHSGTLPRPPHLRRQHDRTRSSRRHRQHHQNPVTRLIDHHQQLNHVLNDSSTSNESGRQLMNPPAFDPRYTSSQSELLLSSERLDIAARGHTNPIYPVDRPPSARSSYSNYHGTRPFSYSGQATGQVPVANNYRRSYMQSNGPPAYHLHGAVDSETVI